MRDIFGCVLKIEAVLDCTLATGLLARYILPETPKTRLGDFEGVDVEKDGASDGFVSKEVPGAAELPQRSGGKRNGNNHSTDPWKRCHNRRPLQVAWVALRKGLRTGPPQRMLVGPSAPIAYRSRQTSDMEFPSVGVPDASGQTVARSFGWFRGCGLGSREF